MPLSLAHRSREAELLDSTELSGAEVCLNLAEIESINRLLGGHNTTIAGIRHFVKNPKHTYAVLDIGCGGGDSLLALQAWGQNHGFQFQLHGIDILPDAVDYSRDNLQHLPNARVWQQDFHTLPDQPGQYDIVLCSLFCHHLYDEDLKSLLRKMVQLSRLGIVINDLHRHPLAYYSIKVLTALLSRSHMTRNDAALSVRKGFRMDEWRQLLEELDLGAYHVQWRWAFRHLVMVDKKLEQVARAS
jgi:2-polyprenyl-3-methyl-5-hydroxy-6-metoxy-1,4-benzoquinol methylase